MKKYIPLAKIELGPFLEEQLFSKKLVKKMLQNEQIWIHGKAVTQYHFLLEEKQEVIVLDQQYLGIPILYEDQDLLVVCKPFSMLCIADRKEKEKTLYHLMSTYVKQKKKTNKIFIVHRLDYDTGGLVVFAKNKQMQVQLQSHWQMVTRKYLAIVHGALKGKGTLRYFLKENQAHLVYPAKHGGKEAITHYEVLKSTSAYSLLSLQIQTGRKHQIRVSLKEFGYPIVGDQKYGIDSSKQFYLYASEIKFFHPRTKETIHLGLPTPSIFLDLFKNV